ncbi:MAG: carbamoyltransferase HypF [Desulfobulbaceae bacterium]|nr:carbamoyltransferase HypF [Desulfobulbaceae bacterium]
MRARAAAEIRVNGTVQGVGFRPFVYRLAHRFNLAGHITNSAEGVVIRVAGEAADIDALVDSIKNHPPPLARIVTLRRSDITLTEQPSSFLIIESDTGGQSKTHVSPDIATCADCRREITDPADRRLLYPFTNCTNCGPRYTIIRSLPYDRPRTTMAYFSMCPECSTEYTDPQDRRFHAQPNACPVCGPELEWRDNNSLSPAGGTPLDRAVQALADHRVVGIKGLGGFHLAASAYSTRAVARLRERKNRPAKPLAIMIRDLETARQLCHISPTAHQLLASNSCPIVLLQKKDDCGLADNLAPGLDELGVMLPYTPLHHLLFARPQAPACLVMTSGNAAGEPLCKDNDDALQRLGSFCDGFLLHNRIIHTRVDDSVIRVIGHSPRFLRRSRGYAPAPVRLARRLEPILAVGGELKNCFCLARDRDAFMSQHIGDLNNLSTPDFFHQTFERLKDLLEIEPQAVAADLHPDYLSTRFAEDLNLPITRVQHHWAHAASVMAEHGLDESLAIILDGTGYGPDGTVWGGEVLHCSLHEYKRLGRLSPLPLPGGDRAARQPWRMALAALQASGINDPRAAVNLAEIDERQQQFIREMIDKGVNCPPTSSCGRLFDGVSSLLGICQFNTFEGQAAMELEAAASRALGRRSLLEANSFTDIGGTEFFHEKDGLLEIRTPELIQILTGKMAAGSWSVSELALFFHLFLVSSFGNMIGFLSRQTGIDTVVLSGGSVQNRILTEGFIDFFSLTHLKLHTNVQVPANDGGLALGQAVIGGAHVSGYSHAG